MTRLVNWLLAAALLVSALALVNSRYHERRLFALAEQMERQIEKRVTEIENLQVAVTSLRTPGRLASVAKDTLGMVPITHAETVYAPKGRQP
ncbi:MAG: cell division protein FtsL [Burkholderiaceae bacterium]